MGTAEPQMNADEHRGRPQARRLCHWREGAGGRPARNGNGEDTRLRRVGQATSLPHG
jgi:hypothetical protein